MGSVIPGFVKQNVTKAEIVGNGDQLTVKNCEESVLFQAARLCAMRMGDNDAKATGLEIASKIRAVFAYLTDSTLNPLSVNLFRMNFTRAEVPPSNSSLEIEVSLYETGKSIKVSVASGREMSFSFIQPVTFHSEVKKK